MAKRRRIVGVMGSAAEGHADLARPLGSLIARMGCHLLTGGGPGVMLEVSRAFCETSPREGLCLGVIKAAQLPSTHREVVPEEYVPGRPNDWVEIPIYTHLPYSGDLGTDPLSRNHINVLTADVLIALPGGPGTLSEVRLRCAYGRHVLLYVDENTIGGLTCHELAGELGEVLSVARSLDDVEAAIQNGMGVGEGS